MVMHADQHSIDLDIVRRLLAAQFPEWKRLPLRPVAGAGTDNAIFRIGKDLSARFRLEGTAVTTVGAELATEASALDALGRAIPFATPRQVAVGVPGEGYPLPWSIQTWVPGDVATPTGSSGSLEVAEDISALISALRSQPTGGRTFRGTGRGGDLPDHAPWVEHCLNRSEALLDTAPLRRLWSGLIDLPRSGEDVMSHGDLTPFNLVLRDNRLAGVLDPAYGPADPALDLVAAWHLFDAPARLLIRTRLGSDDLEWARGAAWSLIQALGLPWYYETSNPRMAALGRSTLTRLADAAAELI